MSRMTRALGLVTAAVAALLVVALVASPARTRSAPESDQAGAGSLPIGIMNLMQSSKDLPQEQHDAF